MSIFHRSHPENAGTVSGAPDLPDGFTDTFESRMIDAGDVQLHAVVGGEGPPLLLVHGWPETWYAWRLLMPSLARDFAVVAVDQRGMGLSDKPVNGYDTRTMANDLVALMDTLGHGRFAVVGHDTGFEVAYAVAADHPERVERATLIELPAALGAIPSPPLFTPPEINDRIWHLAFNRMKDDLPLQLVEGREAAFFGYEFRIQGTVLPQDTVDYYVGLLSNPESLRGSFGFYRALDETLAQDQDRAKTKLPMPVQGIGGERSYGDTLKNTIHLLSDDAQGVVIPDAGHFLAEEAPDAMLEALTDFLAPYRDGAERPAPAL